MTQTFDEKRREALEAWLISKGVRWGVDTLIEADPATAELARLRKRLEIGGYYVFGKWVDDQGITGRDGIDRRNETIRLQDAIITRLRKQIDNEPNLAATALSQLIDKLHPPELDNHRLELSNNRLCKRLADAGLSTPLDAMNGDEQLKETEEG